ncbi:type I DNA topoisomerase [Mucilaginibacter sp. ZT4R22]|uniref:DNA topoisomerase 1 n=1 Tax=Mucilaginibacter pankratovii TaxID=2772110 RepID=A0ABR7WLP2_9SPHI|nr:type I DNA topoisomerase [Mucilaginibacter pankratovii]MBD1362222.1 type I DNA topoisomerase [Mucilaginibacter pankratovii]
MAKNLLIVESPAKAKTIEGYLGKDFTVKSSYGHIRDLVKSEDAIDINNNFEQKYEVPADKKQVVSELKKLAKEADMVWLASDEDREGEAISWHLFDTLNLKDATTKRIVFHEITKPAILRAIENPRKIDYNLVNAQQARRVLDRLVGFELSPVLWKKVKPSLSAGRVQSVAVRLIVDREREVNKFKSDAAFKIVAIFDKGRNAFKAELAERFAKQDDAEKFLQDCVKAIFEIKSLDTRPTKRSPAAPFTTSTLQQEASRKLGYSVARTMQVAQRLYESGHITYMRTDSVNLSDTAIAAAASEIVSAWGDKYHQSRKYKTKNASAQEAHEAIRPTYFNNHTINGESNEKRLYELIWKRAIASQMSEAQFEKTVAKISISTRKEDLTANGEVMKFDGFLKVYLESNDDEEDNQTADGENAILPPLTKGQLLDLQEMTATERFSRPPARYTEASLVKKLEELGIGRPSTYAPTISTIQNRGYVVKEEREGRVRNFRVMTLKNENITKEEKSENTGAERGKLFPTDIGAVVNDFLVQHFQGIVDFNFTASVEKQFDEIAQGLQDWTKMIRTFYDPFHKDVQSTIETADKATGERELGVHPESGKKMSVRIGRYGPFVQVGETATEEGEEKPLYASLRTGQSIETISLEEALELFKLPKVVGEYEGKIMKVAIGRFGPYISHNSAFVSLPKEIDPLDVTEEQAIELIEAKRKKDAERLIKSFPEDETVKVLNGRWGPYIEFGKLNVKIPKDITDPLTLTYEQCKALADAMPKDAKKGRFGKSAPAKAAAPAKKAPAKKKAVAKKK